MLEDGLPKFIDPRCMEDVWAEKSAHTAKLLGHHLKDVTVDLVRVEHFIYLWRGRKKTAFTTLSLRFDLRRPCFRC